MFLCGSPAGPSPPVVSALWRRRFSDALPFLFFVTYSACRSPPMLRSWLQNTLKRKVVDFAWNRRFFYLPGACLHFFGETRLKVSINPIFFIWSACFYQSSGQPRVNPGKQEGGGARKKSKSRRVFFSRYLAANDGALAQIPPTLCW